MVVTRGERKAFRENGKGRRETKTVLARSIVGQPFGSYYERVPVI